jgi:LAO/AO transport system kinase
MEKKELLTLIRENLEDGKLACDRAYKIAEEHDLKLWQIGKICDEEKIKIKGCQLGCF